jgi:RecA-family ATPase
MSNINEALAALSVTSCDYQEWVQVGMAIFNEGLPMSVWDDWSRADKRYREGECAKKWAGFQQTHSGVAGGTIVKLAMDKAGFKPVSTVQDDTVYDWNSEIRVGVDEPESKEEMPVIVHRGYVEPVEIKPLETTPNNSDLKRYLEAVFQPDECVGYSVESFMSQPDKEGNTRMLPTKGVFTRKAKDLIAELERYDKFGATCIPKAMGQWNETVGAWIRFNPLDGKDCKDLNVTSLRHALVECDNIPPEQQLAIIRELQLPCTAIVHSGKKSIHAIVRVDAKDMAEYRKRVDFLYGVCAKNGLTIDTQNKNPSRLSRMPGVTRNGVVQALLDVHAGQPDWASWENWLEEQTDDLPEPVRLSSVMMNLPPLSPEVISGVLRKGHKMLLSAASKAGKTFMFQQMCLAFARGGIWMGHKCIDGPVIYLDFEVELASCYHRFDAVARKMGIPASSPAWDKIHAWSLRGKTAPMDKLVKSIVRRAMKIKPVAIILDPIYKVMSGEENNARDVSEFFIQLDKICVATGTSVISCHHHSKGDQGQKKSSERSSGSGVFGRDPDAVMDFIELPGTDHVHEAFLMQEMFTAVSAYAEKHGKHMGDLGDFKDGTKLGSNAIGVWGHSDDSVLEMVQGVHEAVDNISHWRADYTLREFKKPKGIDLSFQYPVHVIDNAGLLRDLKPEDGRPDWMKEQETKKEARKEEFKATSDLFLEAWAAMPDKLSVTVAQLAQSMFVEEVKVKKIIKHRGDFDIVKGFVVKKG